jgi:preprotein translocase subunit YajC
MAYLLLPILLVLMYLVLLRPQQQRLRAQRSLVASLDVGDEIITAGGIIGRIVALTDERASIEVADGVVIDFLRVAISRRADLGGPVGAASGPATAESGEALSAASDGPVTEAAEPGGALSAASGRPVTEAAEAATEDSQAAPSDRPDKTDDGPR